MLSYHNGKPTVYVRTAYTLIRMHTSPNARAQQQAFSVTRTRMASVPFQSKTIVLRTSRIFKPGYR